MQYAWLEMSIQLIRPVKSQKFFCIPVPGVFCQPVSLSETPLGYARLSGHLGSPNSVETYRSQLEVFGFFFFLLCFFRKRPTNFEL